MIKLLFLICLVLVIILVITLPTFILILYNYAEYFYNEYHNIKYKGFNKRDFKLSPITIGEVHKAVINSHEWKWDLKIGEYRDNPWAGNVSYWPLFSHIWFIIKTIKLLLVLIYKVLKFLIKKLKLDRLLYYICKYVYLCIIRHICKCIVYIYNKLYTMYDKIRQKFWNIKI